MRARGRELHGDSLFEDSFYNVEDGSDSRRNTASLAASTTAQPGATTASYPVSVQPNLVAHQEPSRPTVVHTATNRPISTTGRPVVLPQVSVEDEDGSFYNLDVPMTELGARVPTQQQHQVVLPTANAQNMQQTPTTDGWLRNEFNTSTNNINSTTANFHSPANRALLGSLTPAEIDEIDALCGISSLIQLVEMGFPPEHCRIALKECDGDLSRATVFCLEHGPEQMQWLIRAEANRIARAASETVDVEPTRTKPKKGLFQRLFASKSKATTTVNTHAQPHAADDHGMQHAANRPLSTPVSAGHHPSLEAVAGAATIAPAAAAGADGTQSRTRAQTTAAVTHNDAATSRQVSTPNPHNQPAPHPTATVQQQHYQQHSQAPQPLQQQHVDSHVQYPPPMNPNFVDIPPSPPQHTYHNQQQPNYYNPNQHNFDDFDQPIPEIMHPPSKGGAKKAATAAPALSNKKPISMAVQHSLANNTTNANNLGANKSNGRPQSQQPTPHHDPIQPEPYGMRGYAPAPTTISNVSSSPHTNQTSKPASISPSTCAPTGAVAAPSPGTTPVMPVVAQPSVNAVNPPSGVSSPHPRLAHALLDIPSTSHYGSLLNIDAILQEQAQANSAPAQSEVIISPRSSVTNELQHASIPPSKPPRPASMKFTSARFDKHGSSSLFGKTAFPQQNTNNFGLDMPTFGTGESGFVFESERPMTRDVVVSEKFKAQLPHNPHYYDSAASSTDMNNTVPTEQPHQSYFGSILFSEPFSVVETEAFSAAPVTIAPVSECDSFAPTVVESASTVTSATAFVEPSVSEQIPVETTNVTVDNSHAPMIIDSSDDVSVTMQVSEVYVPEATVPPNVNVEAVAKVVEEDSAVTDTESPVETAVKPVQESQALSEDVHECLVHVDDSKQLAVSLMDIQPLAESVPKESFSSPVAQEEVAMEIPDSHIGEAVLIQEILHGIPVIAERASEEAVALPQGQFLLFPDQEIEETHDITVEQLVDVPADIEITSSPPVVPEGISHYEHVCTFTEPLLDMTQDIEIAQEPIVHEEQFLDTTFQATQSEVIEQESLPVPIAAQEDASITAEIVPTEPRTQETIVVEDILESTTAVAGEEPMFDQVPEQIPAVEVVTTEAHTAVDDAFQIPEIVAAEAAYDDFDEFENFTPVAHSSSAAVEAEVMDFSVPVVTNNVSTPLLPPLQLVPPSVAPATVVSVSEPVPAVMPSTTAAVSTSPAAINSNSVENNPPLVLDRNHPPHLNSIDNMLPTINIAAHSVIVTEEIPDSLHPSASPSVVGEQNGHEVISTSAATTSRISLLRKRQLQPYRIEALRSGKFRAYVAMKQPYLKKNETSPQGNRPDEVILGDCANELIARDLCECFAPPIWQSKALHAASAASNTCTLCQVTFSMFSQPHHCRNCGFLICGNCSDKFWPGTMLPETFHDDEKMIRVCHSCHYLVENFVVALCAGDYQTVRALYATGNINLHQPYSVYTHQAYPVHYAVLGGNLDVLRWLIDVKRCSITNQMLKAPLITHTGWTLLGLAAYCGHVDMVHFLVHQKKCQMSEIKEVITLQRAMHALLRAPGNMPEFVWNQKANPLPSSTLLALQDDMLHMLRHHPRLRTQPLADANTNNQNANNDLGALNSSSHSNNQAFTDSSNPSTHVPAATVSAVPVNANSQRYVIPSATAQEAPVIVASSTIEPAPIQINLLGIQTQVNVTVNSVSQAKLTKPLPKTRCLCSQAVFRVEEFLENQRRTMFYTLPPALQHTNATGGTSETAGSAPNSTRNTSTPISGLLVPAGTANNSTGNDVVALASPVGYPLTANTAQHGSNVALAAIVGASTGSNRSANSALNNNNSSIQDNTSGHSTPMYISATAITTSAAPVPVPNAISGNTVPAEIATSHRSAQHPSANISLSSSSSTSRHQH